MTIVIITRQDLGRVTRILAAHPDWAYQSHAGEHGEIVLDIQEGNTACQH